MVLQITTEAVGLYRPDEQMASVRALRPSAVSLAVREIIPDQASEETAEVFLREIAEWGCSPQYILYDAADAFRFAELIGHGVIPQQHPHAIFVLGRYLKPGEETKPGVLNEFLCDWPESWPWTVCAFGAAETRALAAAVALGGHARVGFENNTLNADGMVAQTNAERVFKLRQAIESFGVRPMDIGETRRLLEASAAV
jgi:uncharacterized protein (DUF849 family)